MRVLLIEEDVHKSQTISQVLTRHLYGVDTVFTGAEGIKYAQDGIYDVVVLGAVLPDTDALDFVRRLRGNGNFVPVMVVSEVDDKSRFAVLLNEGADDCCVMPFDSSEFSARINALSRRKSDFKDDTMTVGDFCLDKTSCEVRNMEGQRIKISLKELLILTLLFESPAKIIKKETIIEKIWGGNSDAEYNNVEVYISFIRKKMEQLGVHARIRTARGIGYSLEESV